MDFPGIEFYNSSDASFERCTFHAFKGTSTPFSEVSEDVHISSCNFTPSNEYTGHGAAIHYVPNTSSHDKLSILRQQFHFHWSHSKCSTH